MSKLLDNKDYGVSPILGTQYPWAREIYKRGASNVWTPLDTPSETDINQWSDNKTLTLDEKLLVNRTLGLFAAGESLVSNSANIIELKFITDGAVRDALTRKSVEECLTSDHQIYTSYGWKDIADITENDLVCAVKNEKNLSCHFENPSRVIEYKNFASSVYRIGTKHKFYECTAYHRCLHYDTDSKTYLEVLAKNINKHNLSFRYTLKTKTVDSSTEYTKQVTQSYSKNYQEYLDKFGNSSVFEKIFSPEKVEEFLFLSFTLNGGYYFDIFSQQFSFEKTEKIKSKSLGIYNKSVYCITVSSGYFLCRNKTSGYIFVTGNTVHNWTAEACCSWYRLPLESVIEAYKNIPSIAAKERFIMNSLSQFDSVYDTQDPENIKKFIRNEIIIYLIVEGLWFISNFVAILSLKRRNILPALGTQIQYTWTDESNHIDLGIHILNTLKSEYPECYPSDLEIYDLFREGLKLEHSYIEDAIPNGLIGLSQSDLKDYAEYLANTNLQKIGLSPIFNCKRVPISWIEEVQGEKIAAFFEVRATNYQTTANLIDDY